MIIGSHDSGAYTFSGILPNIPLLGRLFRALAQTQRVSIEKQLERGVRLLDLRIMHSLGQFYLAHTFRCGKLADEMAVIVKFALNNTNEQIIINIRADRFHEKQFKNKNLVQKLTKELETLELPNITLNTNKGILRGLYPTKYDEIGPSANTVADIHLSFSRRAPFHKECYVSFTVAATPSNLTKMILRRETLLTMGAKARKIYSGHLMPDNVIGVMFDDI